MSKNNEAYDIVRSVKKKLIGILHGNIKKTILRNARMEYMKNSTRWRANRKFAVVPDEKIAPNDYTNLKEIKEGGVKESFKRKIICEPCNGEGGFEPKLSGLCKVVGSRVVCDKRYSRNVFNDGETTY